MPCPQTLFTDLEWRGEERRRYAQRGKPCWRPGPPASPRCPIPCGAVSQVADLDQLHRCLPAVVRARHEAEVERAALEGWTRRSPPQNGVLTGSGGIRQAGGAHSNPTPRIRPTVSHVEPLMIASPFPFPIPHSLQSDPARAGRRRRAAARPRGGVGGGLAIPAHTCPAHARPGPSSVTSWSNRGSHEPSRPPARDASPRPCGQWRGAPPGPLRRSGRPRNAAPLRRDAWPRRGGALPPSCGVPSPGAAAPRPRDDLAPPAPRLGSRTSSAVYPMTFAHPLPKHNDTDRRDGAVRRCSGPCWVFRGRG